ncbi:TlyA family RNA methyltransferase [Alicyclobacillus mali]|uniref:TlyA family RNA methyltransferase n=1 Tax=Alicyclobacillus mali (ex Roth et al. 2021) TaxID=1123961 RepID=A0ABS0F5X4_9BACL|nr:TlyA family RNA methyltransferase [Alicyclobacillus mali (ex Roth et al. 2021)]MBF8378700.1 TlyA family RNA methyltransferase [Alicyclobacillus mali (ex Roth et al. 2021)]MCL6487433.1 TlyA family RNA methyltransferase [Alicyclobacillus mali (ex Roth et al. 2021)]
MNKMRLDLLLVEKGLYASREAARRAIMAGLVRVDGLRAEKPGARIAEDAQIHVDRPSQEYASRGGLKLERALDTFGISVADRVAIDVGASTGGFTDCLLQRGARLVYAVDVGYGQLAWRLRQDTRVRVMERTNFRHVDAALFDPRPDLAVMDVSFISIRLLFPKLSEVCIPHADIVSLIKPQFEAGRDKVGKGGIVRHPEVHRAVLLDILKSIESMGWCCRGLTYSPITGGDGNVEFLGWFRMHPDPDETLRWMNECDRVVQSAWASLKSGTHPNGGAG